MSLLAAPARRAWEIVVRTAFACFAIEDNCGRNRNHFNTHTGTSINARRLPVKSTRRRANDILSELHCRLGALRVDATGARLLWRHSCIFAAMCGAP